MAATVGGGDPLVLIAVDSANPSSAAALLDPARMIAARMPVGLVFPSSVDRAVRGALAGLDLELRPPSDRRFARVGATVTTGAYLPAGAVAAQVSERRRVPCFVVQHGLLTPFEAPVDHTAHVLAWTEADARVWTGLGAAVTSSDVGSQLLWRAAQGVAGQPVVDPAPVFLGQLHGIELGRRFTTRTVERLRREGPLEYRPHPAERDPLSRLQHRRWRWSGIDVVAPTEPLTQLRRRVVGMFSTGLLEAAAAGLPAWGCCVDAPAWVTELWSRYGIAPWGSDAPTPTPPPAGEHSPAAVVARRVIDAVG